MGNVGVRVLCLLLGLAALSSRASADSGTSNQTYFPGGPSAMHTPGIVPNDHSGRKLFQVGAATLTTVLADPRLAPGPSRKTTIITSDSAPGPDQHITVGTIQNGELRETTLTTVPAPPPAAYTAGRKLLQGSGSFNNFHDGRDDGHDTDENYSSHGSWNGDKHRGNGNRGGWDGNTQYGGSGRQGSGSASSGAISGNNGGWSGRDTGGPPGGSSSSTASGASSGGSAAAASAAAAVANQGGSASAAAAAAASAAPGSAAASAAAAAAASGKDASAVAAAAAGAGG